MEVRGVLGEWGRHRLARTSTLQHEMAVHRSKSRHKGSWLL